MPLSTQKTIRFMVLTIFAVLALALSSCNALQGAGPASPDSGDDVFEEIDLSGASEEADSGEDSGEDQSGEDESGPEPVMIDCPADPMSMYLIVTHSWDFSPNRNLEMMRVDGQTAVYVSCPLTVHRDKVTMQDCYFPFTCQGYVNTDAGPCDISASGTAVLSVEDAYCQDGKVTMTIIEALDAESEPTGAMNCPKASEPYLPFYPYSLTTRTFFLSGGGSTQTESVDPDLTNQFRYTKTWTLYAKDLPAPSGEGE